LSNQPVVRTAVRDSTLAIISLVFGILGWTLLPTLGALVAIITGYMAKNEIRASNGTLGGEGMAQAGLILGYLHFAILLLVCVVVALIWILGFGSIFLLGAHGK
jgi:Domain of unknown function (DUF4190)